MRFEKFIKYLKYGNFSIEELKVILDVVNKMIEYIEKGGGVDG